MTSWFSFSVFRAEDRGACVPCRGTFVLGNLGGMDVETVASRGGPLASACGPLAGEGRSCLTQVAPAPGLGFQTAICYF